ncbi:MAG: flagellar motor switch protein FliM [Oscillospiraceae bacterium]|jgi:flagellar motor switch protein FliM|nr:flagellar motor switch protein FliM [Oscillospiraceae bacterium]
MAEVLSQQQIDDLLGSLQSGSMDFQEIEEQTSGPKVKDYDFLSPKKFTREQIKLLQNIFESFSRLFSLHLSGVLRMNCQAEVVQVEEEEYKEFGNALNESVLIGIMGLHNADYGIEDKQIIVEMSRPISFCIMDRLLGGNGTGYQIDRDYTEIELSLLEYLFRKIAPILKDAWGNYVDVEHTMDGIETNSQLIQFIQPDESAAIVVIEVTLNELKGNLNICLPASSLEEIFKIFDSKYVKVNRKLDPEQEKIRRKQILNSLEDTPLTVSAILGKTDITVKDLLELRSGDVIPLESPVEGDPVVLQVEKLKWFRGKVGVKKKNYAVQIEKVLR